MRTGAKSFPNQLDASYKTNQKNKKILRMIKKFLYFPLFSGTASNKTSCVVHLSGAIQMAFHKLAVECLRCSRLPKPET